MQYKQSIKEVEVGDKGRRERDGSRAEQRKGVDSFQSCAIQAHSVETGELRVCAEGLMGKVGFEEKVEGR